MMAAQTEWHHHEGQVCVRERNYTKLVYSTLFRLFFSIRAFIKVSSRCEVYCHCRNQNNDESGNSSEHSADRGKFMALKTFFDFLFNLKCQIR